MKCVQCDKCHNIINPLAACSNVPPHDICVKVRKGRDDLSLSGQMDDVDLCLNCKKEVYNFIFGEGDDKWE